MENQTKPQYTVTFDDTNEYFYSSDSAEVILSDEDVTQTGKTASQNLTKTSSTIGLGCEGGDMPSASSISTSILDDVEEIKVLKRKITELETKNKLLDTEIEKVNLCLINERTKTTKLEKKLQFVKDNQDVFIKLKEAYINMKYNEAVGRKMVEIREKGMQTWEGILCRGCIDAEQLRRQLEIVQQTYKDSFFISPLQLEQLLNTLKYLKELVERREASWTEIAERDEKMKVHLHRLEHDNQTLHDLLQTKELIRTTDENGIDEDVNLDLITYKKIIIKYEKKIRELEKNNQGMFKFNLSFNEKERKIIQYLMTKYFSRLNDKNQIKRRCRSTSRVATNGINSCLKTGLEFRYPSKSLNKCHVNDIGDNTLKLMNYFLDSTDDGDTTPNGSRLTL